MRRRAMLAAIGAMAAARPSASLAQSPSSLPIVAGLFPDQAQLVESGIPALRADQVIA